MKITKKWLKSKGACADSFEWFLEQKTEDAETLFKRALEEKRYSDINWTLVRKMNKKQHIMYAIYIAEQDIDNIEKEFPDNDIPRQAIASAKNYLNKPSAKTKSAARSAAYVKILTYGYNLICKPEPHRISQKCTERM